MSICCECCALSSRGLCDELITRPEEPYRPWCVSVCDLENLANEEALAHCGGGGAIAPKTNKQNIMSCTICSRGYRGNFHHGPKQKPQIY
jgi:hypothetical protein